MLAPTGGLTGRFDLANEPAAYLADSPETALYESAQHPHHSCVCLFKSGIEQTKKLTGFGLVEPGTGNLLKSAAIAARGSQVPIVRE